MTPIDSVLRDSKTAWSNLKRIGGIEPTGRDSDFVDALRCSLDEDALTIDQAIEAASVDQLVRAVFALSLPYAEMFRDILNFFRAAGVRQGQSQWRIAVEDDHVDLKDFEVFLECWDKIEVDLDVPQIEAWRPGAFTFRDCVDDVLAKVVLTPEELEESSTPRRALGDERDSLTGLADIDAWVADFPRELKCPARYGPYPRSIHPLAIAPELRELAALAYAVHEIILNNWTNREELLRDYNLTRGRSTTLADGRDMRFDEENGFALGTIAQHETDGWLRNSIWSLGKASSLDAAHLAAIETALKATADGLPRRTIQIRSDACALERILDLPV